MNESKFLAAASRVAAVALALAIAGPARGGPCAGFTDVDNTSPFCSSVTWIRNAGITLGCTDTLYCPDAPVLRLQMAAFLYRLRNVVFTQGGNTFGAPAVLGTLDNQTLDIVTQGARVMRLQAFGSMVVGDPGNTVGAVGSGRTIAGGGIFGTNCYEPTTATFIRACRNEVTGDFSSVLGGNANFAHANYVVVGGGASNTAASFGSVVGGGKENLASGSLATIPGGATNTAVGDYSFAAGVRAKALHHRSFVWGGSTTLDTHSVTDGDFAVYAPGRIRLYAATQNSGGCVIGGNNVGGNLTCDGVITATSFVPPSDRALKSEVVPVDAAGVLARVVAMPIAEWSYTASPGVRHMGPMGQDFHAAFGLGATDKGIATVDADGVALAAIQGLNAKLEATVAEQKREITELRRLVEEMRAGRCGLALPGACASVPRSP